MYTLLAFLAAIAFVILIVLFTRRFMPRPDKRKPLLGILGLVLFALLVSSASDLMRPVYRYFFNQQLMVIEQERDLQSLDSLFQELPFLKELQAYYPQEAEELKERVRQTWRSSDDHEDIKEVQAHVQALAAEELEGILESKIERASNRSVGEFALHTFAFLKRRIKEDPQTTDGLFDFKLSELDLNSDDDPDGLMNLLVKVGKIIESSALSPQSPPTRKEVEAATELVFKDVDRLFEKYDTSLFILMAGLEKPSLYKDLDQDLVNRFKMDLLDIFSAGPVEEVGLMVRGSFGK